LSKSKAQTCLVKEQGLKIKAEEAETLRNCEALETKENLTQLFPLGILFGEW
jgi:hypothetical protein